MRWSPVCGWLFAGLLAFVGMPATGLGQFGGSRPPWGGGGASLSQDPNSLFDFMAKGRPYFIISETRRLRDPLMQYAQQKGITNGQMTRQQFIDFNEQMKSRVMSSGFPLPPGPGPAVPPSTNTPTPQNPDAMNQWADADFKRQDTNGDGKLNTDEMPSSLKNNLARWDTNKDGFIDPTEYRAYFLARLQGLDQDTGNSSGFAANPITTIIIEEEDWDRKPVVLRAGKLPDKGLPSWFKDLDTDGDGQVALYEWRKGGKPLDEFKIWDSDDDGFITPEEAMKHEATLTKNNPALARSNASGPGGPTISGESGSGSRPPWGKGGGKNGGFSLFGKGKKNQE